jgi:hypothetical protein
MEECVHGHGDSRFQQKQTGIVVQIKRHNSKVEKVVLAFEVVKLAGHQFLGKTQPMILFL